MIIIHQYRFRREDETQQEFLCRCIIESEKPHPIVTVNGILVLDCKLPITVDDECVIEIL